MEVHTKNAQQTKQLGTKVGSSVKAGVIYYLRGELGAGKTTFVQGFAEGLGIKERIISPTFNIVKSYKSNGIEFVHVDLYRLSKLDKRDFYNLGLGDYLKHAVIVIEWPERIAFELEHKDIIIQIISENERLIKF